MKAWQHCVTNALLLIVMQAFPCDAKEYHIDSQKQFDALSTATFLPGDIILFKKGQQFSGMFAPSGSGTEQAAITIDTYGHGSRPRIDAGGKNIAGLLLRNVAYWEVNGLEIPIPTAPTRTRGIFSASTSL